jgi:LuxR family maltose regulon positive regulatory protein
LERLEERRYRPLTLVSAPPGYGKSTLVSCWLDGCETPFGWLSLDEHDNDLHQFLTYFVAAVQSRHGTEFPDAFSKTMTLINAPILPPIPVLASSLTNELDSIEQDFILVLDDIHCIQDKSVHDLLKMLLHHPPRPMHLVLIGRRDPPLPMSKLRGRDQVTEIRTLDLSFTTAETAEFLKIALEERVDESAAATLAGRAEGWVTGLRLAVLAVRGHPNAIDKLLELKGTTAYVMDYLIKEVVEAQLPVIRRYLLSSSILDRLCAPLCDALCGPDLEAGEGEIDGQGFVTSLQQNNLLVIPLDTENRWFRYHHLFQNLLQDHLKRKYSSEEIATLHSRASEWFESQGMLRESIEHALAAGDMVRGVEIIERYRNDEFTADRWHMVQQWLSMLPADIKRKRPKLLLTEAWIANLQHQLGRVPILLDQAETLPRSQTEEPTVLAEIAFFRGYITYFEGQAERSLQHLEDAVSELAGTNSPFLGEAELMLGLARCMLGQKDPAVRALKARIGEVDSSKNYLLSRLIAGLAFIYLLSGDLHPARAEAQRLQEVSKKHNMALAEAWSYYMLSCTYLHNGEFEAASLHFAQAVEMRYVLEPRAAVDALAGLALTQQLMQEPNDAAETAGRLQEFARELRERNYLSVAISCQVRLALLRGDLNSAVEWGQSVNESPVLAELFSWLEAPSITRARVLIAEGTNDSLGKASELLATIRQLIEACQFTCQMIEVAVLQSMVLEKLGRSDEALIVLEEVVALAGPGGWVRPFIEAGPKMADLLKRLQKQNVAVDYIEKILAALENDKQIVVPVGKPTTLPSLGTPTPHNPVSPSPIPASPQPLDEPLTNRELDILELLAQRLQNKEIAEKLSISPTTVKTHLQNIFQKLQVSNRRQAVESAEALGILSRR